MPIEHDVRYLTEPVCYRWIANDEFTSRSVLVSHRTEQFSEMFILAIECSDLLSASYNAQERQDGVTERVHDEIPFGINKMIRFLLFGIIVQDGLVQQCTAVVHQTDLSL